MEGRLGLIGGAVMAAAAILLLRLFDLQVLEQARYRLAAEHNRVQTIYESAPRGRLFDRNGALLASSRPAFSVVYIPRRGAGKADIDSLAAKIAPEINL